MEMILLYLPSFLLVFCRITSFFVVTPIFSARHVPAHYKIGLSVFLSFIIVASQSAAQPAAIDALYAISIMKEIVIGLLLGFIAYLFFTVVQISGSFVDLQMGFGIANIIDPMTGAQAPLLGNLKFFIATLLFLALNGHHYLIAAILDSYEWVPLSSDLFAKLYDGSVNEFLVTSFSKAFALAFQMAAPFITAMFLVDVGLGILTKVAPQFNVFVIGMPLKVIVGFIMLILLIPGFFNLFSELFDQMFKAVHHMTGLLR
ncbi:flagellar biosynthetic protein FliR [Paenibacillus sp. MBLB4367]|uniref:flagellar biosynthetic protein FliR n=1 Tax=Paenibacillus sp. MBLB4367 TaxID=3384767 RepID=UPI003907EBED